MPDEEDVSTPTEARAAAFARAVGSEAPGLLVIAPPGCGKTELLGRRADFLAADLGRHQRILALTFSNKAKTNLTVRLREVMGDERKRRHVTVRNFHGHAAEIVRAHGATLGIATEFEMPGKRTQALAVAPHLEGLSDNDAAAFREQIDAELRTPKQRPWTDEQVLDWLQEHGSHAAIAVETARQTEGRVFYDDLLRHAQRLLRVPEVARLYRAHFAAVLVDEFQDLSPQQLDLALRSVDRSRTFVGDPLQGIYSWNGARPVRVERILRRLCGEPEGLGVSHRSSPRVLDVLNAISVALGGQAIEAHDRDAWPEGGLASGVVLNTAEDEADYLAVVAGHLLEWNPATTIGVISRAGWRRQEIDRRFASAEVSVTRWDLARILHEPAEARWGRHWTVFER